MADLPSNAVLNGETLYLRRVKAVDWMEAARLSRRSAEFMHHFGPPPPESAYSRKAFRTGVRDRKQAWESGLAYSFHIFRHDTNALLGFANLHHIDRDASSAMLGFAIGVDHARQGIAYQAGNILLDLAFNKLGLKEDGVAPNMLRVGEELKDARRFGLLQQEWRRSTGSARPLTTS